MYAGYVLIVSVNESSEDSQKGRKGFFRKISTNMFTRNSISCVLILTLIFRNSFLFAKRKSNSKRFNAILKLA